MRKYPKIECPKCNVGIGSNSIKKHIETCSGKKICPVCEKEFVGKSVTCSHSCSNVYFSHIRNKPERYKNYVTICFKHHEKKCIVCGEEKIVSVHHLNGKHNDNRPENLIPLCPTHHQYVHSRYKDEVQLIIDDYIKKKFTSL